MPDGGSLEAEGQLTEADLEKLLPDELVFRVPESNDSINETPAVLQTMWPTSPETDAASVVPSVESSSVVADEQAYEAMPETQDHFLETPNEEAMVFEQAGSHLQAVQSAPVGSVAVGLMKDAVVLEVEKILEEGLGDYYETLPEEARARFHARGEEAAFKIADMVRSFKVSVKKVLMLIRQWLQTIPGVNRFFLEQESKIKTDRIIALEEARRQEHSSPT